MRYALINVFSAHSAEFNGQSPLSLNNAHTDNDIYLSVTNKVEKRHHHYVCMTFSSVQKRHFPGYSG